jgi:hypothetical protein
MAAMKSMVAMAVNDCYGKQTVALESQWLLFETLL